MTEMIACMREKGFWPVYEGKCIEQYLVGQKAIRWWLSVQQTVDKYGHPPSDTGNIVFRDIASNTNERTSIATVLPDYSVGAHSLNGLLVEHVRPDAAVTVMNSFCFDFAVRLRTAGTHLSFTYMRPMPVPDASNTNALHVIPTQLAWESGATHISEITDLWPDIWQANRAVAETYGLSAGDFEHILNSFPVFARKRPEFFAYLQTRLAEWKAESGGQAAVVRPYPLAEDSTELPMAAEGNFITMTQWDRANWPSHTHLSREEAITRPEEVSMEEFAAMVYPATETDKAICATALAAVEQSPGLSSMDHLDVLLLATHPAWCQMFLDYAGRPPFDAVVDSAPRTLFVNKDQSIRWKECRDYLEQLQAISVRRGDKSQAINLGDGSTSAKSDLPGGMDEVVGYAIKAMKRIAELRKDLSIVPKDQLGVIQAFEEQHRLYQLAA